MKTQSRGVVDGMCGVCRGTIKSGDGRYRIGEKQFHPECFRFWLAAPSPR